MVSVFMWVYMHITPVKELRLIREGSAATALSFGGALIGFCLTLASSISHADTIPNFIIWGIGAAIIQLLVFWVVTHLIPKAHFELESNNIAVGGLFASISIAIGIINAACLS